MNISGEDKTYTLSNGQIVQVCYDVYGVCKVTKEVIEELIDALDKTIKYKWTSVHDKLPEEGHSYLVCLEDGDIFEDDYYSYGWDDWGDEVVAWMPLPEPYKEEE